MQRSQIPTTQAKTRVHRVAMRPRPATISMMPTMIMNVRPLNGSMLAKNGAIYFSQCTSRLVNLSSPATMGTIPNTIFRVDQTGSAPWFSILGSNVSAIVFLHSPLTADQVVNSGTSGGSLPPTDLLDERSAGCPARDKRGFASDLAARSSAATRPGLARPLNGENAQKYKVSTRALEDSRLVHQRRTPDEGR